MWLPISQEPFSASFSTHYAAAGHAVLYLTISFAPFLNTFLRTIRFAQCRTQDGIYRKARNSELKNIVEN